jgi:alpha-tubulin suppressor-like RCC1 family protein
MALTKVGELWSWGCGAYGALGLGNSNDKNIPCKINLSNIISIRCGAYHNIAIAANYDIYVWGFNRYGNLGLDQFDDENIPRKLKIIV